MNPLLILAAATEAAQQTPPPPTITFGDIGAFILKVLYVFACLFVLYLIIASFISFNKDK